MEKISKELDNLVKSVKKEFGSFVGNITFDFEEQELIRRVFKSIFSQIKSKRDKATARSILRKTEWIDD